MPLSLNYPVSLQVVKVYKEFLRKIHHSHVDDNPYVIQKTHYILAEFENRRIRGEANFDRAFSKFRLVMLNARVKTLYHTSKSGAKEKIAKARSHIVKYLVPEEAEQAHLASSRAIEGLPQASNVLKNESLANLYQSNEYFRKAVLYLVGRASQAYMTILNDTEVYGRDNVDTMLNRPVGTPLITVSNHVASMDDPLVICSILPTETLSQPEKLRWTLCASDRCFRYRAMAPFFRAGKTLPVVRGKGTAQEGMQAAEDRLGAGDWVHIFPEGTRSRTGEMGPVRKGVGRLVVSSAAAAGCAPMVVPFVHSGMEQVMPRGQILPSVGKQVRVKVGEPIPVEDLMERASALGWSEDTLYCAIAERIGHRLRSIKAELDGLPAPMAAESGSVSTASAQVSGLELFDSADLAAAKSSWAAARANFWEKLRFKAEHRRWLMVALADSAMRDVDALALETSCVGGATSASAMFTAVPSCSPATTTATRLSPSASAAALATPLAAFVRSGVAAPGEAVQRYFSQRTSAMYAMMCHSS